MGFSIPFYEALIKLFPVRHVRSGSVAGVAGVADSYFRPVPAVKNTADHVISLTPQFAWNYRRRVHPSRPATVAGDGWWVIINDDEHLRFVKSDHSGNHTLASVGIPISSPSLVPISVK